MGRHQTKNARRATRRITTKDPNSDQTVKHACGHSKNYTDLPKFNPPLLKMVLDTKAGMACPACNKAAKAAKIIAKKAAQAAPEPASAQT